MEGLVDFMNSNPHGGHAFNEVWLVALVATRTPYVKLATKEVSCFVLSRVSRLPCKPA